MKKQVLVLAATVACSCAAETTYPAGQIRIGTGAFAYGGAAAETPRALVVATDAADDAAEANIASALSLTGGFAVENGHLLKTGAGTLALAQPAAGEHALTTDANALEVAEGTLALASADGATNLFCTAWDDAVSSSCQGATRVGLPAADGTARTARLDLDGGYGHFGEYLYLDCGNDGGSSVNLLGGSLLATRVHVGDDGGETMATRPELNIRGGTAKIRYLRIANACGAKGRVTVDGGRLEIQGGIYGNSNGGDGDAADAELVIANGGYVSTGTFVPAHGGPVNLSVRIADGGWLQLYGGYRATAHDAAVTVTGDGGTQASSSDTAFSNTWRIGTKGFTFHSDHVNTLSGPVEDGAAAPGTFTASGNGTLKLLDTAAFTGEIAASGTTALVLSGNVAASRVTMASGALSAEGTDATIRRLSHAVGCPALFSFAVENGAARQLHLSAWDFPGLVRMRLAGLAAGNTYALFTCPASCGLTADAIATASVNDSLSCAYSVTVSGDTATVKVTATAASAVLPTASAQWADANGGAWADGANWSGGAAPAQGYRTAVLFPSAASAENTAVTLDTAATLSGLAFRSQPSFDVDGFGSIDVSKSGTAVVSSTLATNKVSVPMSYSGNLRIAVQQKARLELASLSGTGDVTFNDGETGGAAADGAASALNGRGTVSIADISGLRGTLGARNGLFETAKIGSGLTGLTLGYGVFRYAGADDAALNGPLALAANNWAQSTIDVSDADATLTILGNVSQTAGAFGKKGQGALVLDGDGANTVGTTALYAYDFSGWKTTENGWTPGSSWPIDGGCNNRSFCGMLCAGGKTVWGKDGQTLTILGKDLWIGSTTTATPGGEHDAEAEINGGTTTVAGGIVVSRNHGNATFGTADKDTLLSRLTLNAGNLSATTFYMPNNDWLLSKNDSQFIQNGGELTLSGSAEIGLKGAGGTATWTMNGGTATIGGAFRLSSGGATGPETTLNLNGGTLSVAGAFQAQYGVSTLNLNEGAVLRAASLGAAGTSYDNTLDWNGGRFVCANTTTATLQGFKTLNVGEKGAWLDTSGMTAGNLAFKNLVASCADALHVCGATPFRAVLFRDFAMNEAAVAVEKNGSALFFKDAGANLSVTVKDGGFAGAVWTSDATASAQVKRLTLGESSGDRPCLFFHHGSGYLTPMRVTDALAVNATVEVALMDNAQTAFTATAFANKTILIAPKGSIDASKFRFTDRTPTVSATFTVSSRDDGNDQLVMTTTVSAGTDNRTGHTWTAGGGGAWTDGANWSSAPADAVNDKILFPSTLADATVSLDGERTLGAIESAASGTVKLTGGTLSVASTVGGTVAATAGTLVVPALDADANGLALSASSGAALVVDGTVSTPAPATAVTVNPSSGAGTVRLAAAQGAQAFTSSSGTLEGPAAAFGGGQITVKNSTLRITEGGFVESPVTDGAAGLNLRTEAETWFDARVDVNGPFVKTGPGTAYLSGTGNFSLGRSARGQDDNANNPIDIQANGDLPTYGLDACNIAAGTLALVLGETQTATIASRLRVGARLAEFDADGDLVQPMFEVRGNGTVTLGDVRLGVNCGRYRAVAGHERAVLRPTMNVYGGTVNFGGFYSSSDNTGYANAVSTLNLYGGTMTSSSKWIAIGYQRTSYQPVYGQAKTVLNIHGGKLAFTSADYAPGPISAGNADVDINLYGGELSFAGVCKVIATSADTIINIRFDGGTLSAPELVCATYGAGGVRALHWDGGTFRPTADGKALAANWSANSIGADGAKFDLSAIPAGAYTLDKSFAHDADAPAEDGGLELTAGGTLVLNAANTFTGPVTVRDGTVRPTLPAAVPGGLVLAGGTFDGNGFAFTVPYLKGAGGTAANGTLAVTDTLAPLDDAATDAPYATVETLVLADGAVARCPVAQDADGTWTAPYFRVTASCTGRITFAFGLDDETVLPADFRVKVAEFTAGTVPAISGVNYGAAKNTFIAKETVRDAATGVTSVYAVLKPAGTTILFR